MPPIGQAGQQIGEGHVRGGVAGELGLPVLLGDQGPRAHDFGEIPEILAQDIIDERGNHEDDDRQHRRDFHALIGKDDDERHAGRRDHQHGGARQDKQAKGAGDGGDPDDRQHQQLGHEIAGRDRNQADEHEAAGEAGTQNAGCDNVAAHPAQIAGVDVATRVDPVFQTGRSDGQQRRRQDQRHENRRIVSRGVGEQYRRDNDDDVEIGHQRRQRPVLLAQHGYRQIVVAHVRR